MRSFDHLLSLLAERGRGEGDDDGRRRNATPDPRRAEGKLYQLSHVLLFAILTVVTGGNSYRSIETFIKVHPRRLNAAEQVFRRHATGLLDGTPGPTRGTIALDGKVLRRSFDNFSDRKAAQVLHAFDTNAGLVLAHIDVDEKSNEIPAAQQLLGELNVAHSTITLDALHCQKKPMWTAPEPASPISSDCCWSGTH